LASQIGIIDAHIVNDPLIEDFWLIFRPSATNLSVGARGLGSLAM
jgi:hypothetical protein